MKSHLILIVGGIGLFLLGIFFIVSMPVGAIVVEDVVEDLGECLHENQAELESFPCVREKIQSLLLELPAHEIMRAVEASFPYQCHAVGHILGQETYKMLGSVESAFGACSPASCVHACTHGVVGEVFLSTPGIGGLPEEWRHPNIDLIRSEGSLLCRDRTTCHAVGHVLFLLFFQT